MDWNELGITGPTGAGGTTGPTGPTFNVDERNDINFLDIMNMFRKEFERQIKPVVKCEYCGQMGFYDRPCPKCGAPMNESGNNIDKSSEYRKAVYGY